MYRFVAPYCPTQDAAERHPDWDIAFENLHGIRVVYSRSKKVILLDRETFKGQEEDALARAIAAIDLDLLQSQGQLSQEQVEPAGWLARMRLDRPTTRAC